MRSLGSIRALCTGRGQRKRPLGLSPTAFVLSRRRPTFPPSCPGSIIGDAELNCRVRNGNGCDLRSMTTGNLKSVVSCRLSVVGVVLMTTDNRELTTIEHRL